MSDGLGDLARLPLMLHRDFAQPSRKVRVVGRIGAATGFPRQFLDMGKIMNIGRFCAFLFFIPLHNPVSHNGNMRKGEGINRG